MGRYRQDQARPGLGAQGRFRRGRQGADRRLGRLARGAGVARLANCRGDRGLVPISRTATSVADDLYRVGGKTMSPEQNVVKLQLRKALAATPRDKIKTIPELAAISEQQRALGKVV